MRANLKAEADQKAIFQEIRNFLAGRLLGATRDRALLEEVMKCLFTRKQMLVNGVTTARQPTDDMDLAKLYREHFKPIPGLFTEKDQILLDPPTIRYIDQQIARIDPIASSTYHAHPSRRGRGALLCHI